MFDALPELLESRVCLACDGCCRFSSGTSCWRPKVEAGFKYADDVGDDGSMKTKDVGGEFDCVAFQRADHVCRIYDDRPLECRLYPFLLVLHGGRIHLGLHLSCPFVLEHRQDDFFVEHIDAVKQYFANDQVRAFLQANTHLAAAYAPYLNEIEILFPVP